MPADADTSAAPQDLPTLPESVVVPMRLGNRAATAGRRVHVPKGPLGFQDHHDFALVDLPDPELAQFKLLRSLEDQGPVLIVTPIPESGGPIADEDRAEIAGTAGIFLEDAVFLLIVTVRPTPEVDGLDMSINLRAPIVFNPATRLARQCVIRNPRYRVQQPFFGWTLSRAPGRGR
jgi:flagellar assembly factor FliW